VKICGDLLLSAREHLMVHGAAGGSGTIDAEMALMSGRMAMGKSRKRTKRGDHYETMAAGYQILKSPLADSYSAAAEHYRERDPPLDPPLDSPDGSDTHAARKLERESERD
jgi:hypothetical protein